MILEFILNKHTRRQKRESNISSIDCLFCKCTNWVNKWIRIEWRSAFWCATNRWKKSQLTTYAWMRWWVRRKYSCKVSTDILYIIWYSTWTWPIYALSFVITIIVYFIIVSQLVIVLMNNIILILFNWLNKLCYTLRRIYVPSLRK